MKSVTILFALLTALPALAEDFPMPKPTDDFFDPSVECTTSHVRGDSPDYTAIDIGWMSKVGGGPKHLHVQIQVNAPNPNDRMLLVVHEAATNRGGGLIISESTTARLTGDSRHVSLRFRDGGRERHAELDCTVFRNDLN